MTDDIQGWAAVLREIVAFGLGSLAGMLWVVLGIAFINWVSTNRRRLERLARMFVMAANGRLKRVGEIHSSLIFALFVSVAQVLGAAMLFQAAGSQAVGSDEPSVKSASSSAIYRNPELVGHCLVGSALGAAVSVILFPGKAETERNRVREMAAKAFASLAIAVIVCPYGIRYMGMQGEPEAILFASGGVSLCGVSLVSSIVPLFERRAINKAKSKLDEILGPEEQEPPSSLPPKPRDKAG